MDNLDKLKKWVDCNFSTIPVMLLEKAYRDDEITILSGGPAFPMWGYVFVPDDPFLSDLIKKNAKKVYKKTGFIVYETDEIGVYLGVDGAGYDFYEAHWLPLYNMLKGSLK